MTDLAAEAAIRRTLARYCQLCDDGRFDEWADLFTEDATFAVSGRETVGRAAIQAFIEAAQPPEKRGKHALVQSVIDSDGATATALTDYVFVARTGEGAYAITSAGRYHDALALGDDGTWRFTTREIRFL